MLPQVPLYCTYDAHSSEIYWLDVMSATAFVNNGGGWTDSHGGTLTTSDAVYGIMTSAILTSTATSVAPCNEAVTPSSGVSGTVRSPVTIHAYDENGNHVGLENGILVNEIGNDVFYSLESGYETIKIMGNRKITFKIIGTADGEFGFDFLKWKEDGTKTEKSFENITISEGGGYSIDAS